MRVDIPEEGVFWDNARLILSESEVLWLRHYLGDGGEVGETVGRFCPADVFCVLSFFLSSVGMRRCRRSLVMV